MEIIRDIWLCGDCLPVAVNGDYSHLDYTYEGQKAARVAKIIDDGLARLPGLVPDFTSETERVCSECGHIGPSDTFPDDTEPDEDFSYQCCPKCKSWDTSERDSGELEFSRIECDCCGDDLAGGRFRFAQLVKEAADAT